MLQEEGRVLMLGVAVQHFLVSGPILVFLWGDAEATLHG